VAKFEHHQPLYRQEHIFKLHGDEIPRQTQCSWLATVAELLEPVYKRMTSHVLQSGKIHTDDTPIRVLAPGTGKTRTARFWVYLGDDAHPFTVFDYTPNRSRDGPQTFLRGYKGYLQADAYTGYDRLYAGREIIEVACWAHTRRKFFEARDTDARADEMLALIGELYAVEKFARPLNAAGRQQLREAQARPVLARIKVWLKARVLDTLPKSPLGQALTYALNQWTALTRFVENGALEADNNLGENALRPICLGRKNYLFVGSDAGGRSAAILYSLVRSCERHRVNAFDYLRDILIRISTHPASQLDDLLPHRWTPAQ
jgi:transposase